VTTGHAGEIITVFRMHFRSLKEKIDEQVDDWVKKL